jgi:hypothetical protein
MATIKQKRAAKEILKAIEGNSQAETTGEILENVGYSKGISENPKVVLESAGFKEILDKYLPDDFLAKKHTQLLDDEQSQIQIKALDLAYKVKGCYAAEKTQSINVNLTGDITMTPKEKEIAQEYEERLKDSILAD